MPAVLGSEAASSAASANGPIASARSPGVSKRFVGILGDHVREEAIDVFGAPGAGFDKGRRGRNGMRHELLAIAVVGLSSVGRPAGEQEKERATQAVDVGPDIDGTGVLPLFGGHVVDRAHEYPVLGERLGMPVHRLGIRVEFRQAEVEEFHHAGAAHDQVRRLDVPMYQPVRMGVLEAQRGLSDHFAGCAHAERPLPAARAVRDEPLKIHPVDILHDEKVRPRRPHRR